jgi:GTPase SAR1 family protein
MTRAPVLIQLTLISHTNVGKTTLARTLTGIDVGEVIDAPHVTTLSEFHTLFKTPEGDSLRLWDTPGFGDSVRLLKRLNVASNPIGWFLREVVDRFGDRPFWLNQQAIRTARDESDVILYLVNSSENPKDAGYLAPEMKILQWLDKPVVVLLNQMGPPRPSIEEMAERSRWRDYLSEHSVVRDVIAMDAFARCWVHERVFYEAVRELIAPSKKEIYEQLFLLWEKENETRFQNAMALIATQIAAAARDKELVKPKGGIRLAGLGGRSDEKRQGDAMNELVSRLNQKINECTLGLLELHKLDAGSIGKINERVRSAFVIKESVSTTKAGVFGAIMSGAVTGLMADLMSGGLTLGTGALVGGVLGAISAAGAAWAFNATTDRNESSVRFTDEFMQGQLAVALLRYLAVIHFGRGRGEFVESEAPTFWQNEVEILVFKYKSAFTTSLGIARTLPSLQKAGIAIEETLEPLARAILKKLYPKT